jgi:hypothetical protein
MWGRFRAAESECNTAIDCDPTMVTFHEQRLIGTATEVAFIRRPNWGISPGVVSRCCRILRRLTVDQGAAARRGAAAGAGFTRYRTGKFASLTKQVDQGRFAGGSTKEDRIT